MSDKPLGRRVPTDFQHIEKYPLRAVAPVVVERVEDCLPLPSFRAFYNQGREGACVGFGSSWAMSILNGSGRTFPKYDARWLYHMAQTVDEWDDTPPADGTSVRAAFDILRDVGHARIVRGKSLAPAVYEGVITNRWAANADEVRTCIAAGIPVVIGVNWYERFDHPTYNESSREYFIPANVPLGTIRGGHCVCIYGASDRRQAFKFVNNWGTAYPLTWLPYTILDRLISEYGEATVITDRS